MPPKHPPEISRDHNPPSQHNSSVNVWDIPHTVTVPVPVHLPENPPHELAPAVQVSVIVPLPAEHAGQLVQDGDAAHTPGAPPGP